MRGARDRRLAVAIIVIAAAFGIGFLIGTAPWEHSPQLARAVTQGQGATVATIPGQPVPGLKTSTTTTATSTSTSTTAITKPSTALTAPTQPITTVAPPPPPQQNDCDHNAYAGCSLHPCGFRNPCSWVPPPTLDAELRRSRSA
jgi:cytoskeletal protein RodZ